MQNKCAPRVSMGKRDIGPEEEIYAYTFMPTVDELNRSPSPELTPSEECSILSCCVEVNGCSSVLHNKGEVGGMVSVISPANRRHGGGEIEPSVEVKKTHASDLHRRICSCFCALYKIWPKLRIEYQETGADKAMDMSVDTCVAANHPGRPINSLVRAGIDVSTCIDIDTAGGEIEERGRALFHQLMISAAGDEEERNIFETFLVSHIKMLKGKVKEKWKDDVAKYRKATTKGGQRLRTVANPLMEQVLAKYKPIIDILEQSDIVSIVMRRIERVFAKGVILTNFHASTGALLKIWELRRVEVANMWRQDQREAMYSERLFDRSYLRSRDEAERALFGYGGQEERPAAMRDVNEEKTSAGKEEFKKQNPAEMRDVTSFPPTTGVDEPFPNTRVERPISASITTRVGDCDDNTVPSSDEDESKTYESPRMGLLHASPFSKRFGKSMLVLNRDDISGRAVVSMRDVTDVYMNKKKHAGDVGDLRRTLGTLNPTPWRAVKEMPEHVLNDVFIFANKGLCSDSGGGGEDISRGAAFEINFVGLHEIRAILLDLLELVSIKPGEMTPIQSEDVLGKSEEMTPIQSEDVLGIINRWDNVAKSGSIDTTCVCTTRNDNLVACIPMTDSFKKKCIPRQTGDFDVDTAAECINTEREEMRRAQMRNPCEDIRDGE